VRARNVVVDANVLFSIELTDLFLTFATRRLIDIRWSEEVLSAVRRSLEVSGRLSTAAIDRRRKLPSVTVGDLLDHWQLQLPRFVDLARES
jgi:hypothetical protein